MFQMQDNSKNKTVHYYVDESGDGILFDKRKRMIAGKEGGSPRFFFLGALQVADPVALHSEIKSLRENLLKDSYLNKIESMQPRRQKTALFFHAKDDCPEVRREVFQLLVKHDLRFFAVIRDMKVIAQKVIDKNKENPNYRYRPNQLYDRCISLLFKERLHQESGYVIQFAKRGSRDRTESMKIAISQAKDSFRTKWGIESTSPIEIVASSSVKVSGLQAVDYFLWALQRLYLTKEDRYWDFVQHKASMVLDRDDSTQSGAGTYYTRKKPLSLNSIIKREPGI